MVVGSRFLEASLYRAPFTRRLGISLLASVVTLITRQRMTDPTSGFRGVNRRGIILFAADYPHDYPEAEANVLASRHQAQNRRGARGHAESLRRPLVDHALRSLYYMVKVTLALFISVFRRYPAPRRNDDPDSRFDLRRPRGTAPARGDPRAGP